MAIAPGPDELGRLEVALLREEMCEKRVAGDVERHSEQYVGAALVDLARQPAVGHIELEEHVTRHEAHAAELGHVPRAHHDAAGIWIAPQPLDGLADLV